MLYNEFLKGTGCKDNEHNFKVYQDLEVMYMNSDLSKAQIYEYGKKLVDNSKSESELRIEAEVKEEINTCKQQIEIYKKEIEWKQDLINMSDPQTEKEWIADCKRMIRYYKSQITYHRNRIKALKWVLD